MDHLHFLARILLPILALSWPALGQDASVKTEAEVRSAGGRKLTGAEVRELYLGNTIYVVYLKNESNVAKGTVVPIHHQDAKTRTVKVGGSKYTSLWWMDGDHYCSEQRFTTLAPRCYALWTAGGSYYSCLQPTGECFFMVRVLPGNPEKL
ncbi:MAG: hypothetical protein LCH95_15470 [Proteobacteria bacterium]|nr:hypothetical protein [Pseudomonadota bacterium]